MLLTSCFPYDLSHLHCPVPEPHEDFVLSAFWRNTFSGLFRATDLNVLVVVGVKHNKALRGVGTWNLDVGLWTSSRL